MTMWSMIVCLALVPACLACTHFDFLEKLLEKAVCTEANLSQMEERLNKLEAIQDSGPIPTVIFTATATSSKDVVEGRPLVFTDVGSNQGDAYNDNSGIFRAPYPGTYSFHVTVCARKAKWVYVTLMAGGSPLVTTGTKDEEGNGVCTSASGVAKLRHGDEVFVKGAWNETAAIYQDARYHTPVFSGVLLQRLIE